MSDRFERDLGGWVDDRRLLDRVYAYSRNPLVMRETGHAYRLVLPATAHGPERVVRLVGLTTVMAERLVMRDRSRRRKHPGRAKSSIASRLGVPDHLHHAPRHSHLRGNERGTRVHRQMAEYILSPEFARINPANSMGFDPYVLRLHTYLIDSGLRPFAGELFVCDVQLGIGFSVDVMAVDKAGELWWIEVKTGYAGGAFDRVGRNLWVCPALAAIASRFPCTPRNQSKVQITLGATMGIRMFNLIEHRVQHLLVLRIDDHYIEPVPVSQILYTELAVLLYRFLMPSPPT
jgi:hypothetical protein